MFKKVLKFDKHIMLSYIIALFYNIQQLLKDNKDTTGYVYIDWSADYY